MRSQNMAFPVKSSVTTFSALSSSRLVTISFCIDSSCDGSVFTAGDRGAALAGPAAMVFCAANPEKPEPPPERASRARFRGRG